MKPTPKPKPPPDPPKSLVDLLRSDKTVLKYFSSLQENLNYDTQKWKDRARNYQARVKELESEVSTLKQIAKTSNNGPKTPAGKSTSSGRKGSSSTKKQSATSKKPPSTETSRGVGVPIEDHMIEFDSSSSSDDDDDENSITKKPKQNKKRRIESKNMVATTLTNGPPTTIPPMHTPQEDLEFATQQLIEAEALLKELSICLIWDFQENNPREKNVRSRVANQDLASQIIKTLKSLSKVQSADNSYFPFMGKDLMPCYLSHSDLKGPEHPAVKGIDSLVKALSIIDAFGRAVEDIEKVENLSAPESLIVGLTNRQSFVNDLVESLLGEMVEFWPVQDRTTRLSTMSLFFDENDAHVIDRGRGEDSKDGDIQSKTLSSKSFVRLASLAERCMIAKLATTILLLRKDPERAFNQLMGYVASSSPSLGLEDYPKLPPVLSFCVIEAIVQSTTYQQGGTSWFVSMIEPYPDLAKALSLVLSCCASIYKQRLASLDNRISDVSEVELAAFYRLRESGGLLTAEDGSGHTVDFDPLEGTRTFIDTLTTTDEMRPEAHNISNPLYLSLIMNGEKDRTVRIFKKGFEMVRQGDEGEHNLAFQMMISSCAAFRQLCIRKIDSFRQHASSSTYLETLARDQIPLDDIMNLLLSKDSRERIALTSFETLVTRCFQCCLLLSQGEAAIKLVTNEIYLNGATSVLLNSIRSMLDNPVVRVINLERRKDRMLAFMVQAMHERLLVMKAIPSLYEENDSGKRDYTSLNYKFGNFAFDGKSNRVQTEERIETALGPRDFDSLVAPKWRPNDLKLFDREAPDSEELVQMSASERACALSHIASWIGVTRTLKSTGTFDNQLEIFTKNVCISGYASGPALLYENESMPPAPVCIIMEDDAILVDRFSDRLKVLLEELPRDFHFCSIGYSRPKTAPLLPYSTQVGIPTSIWYLTGYILSLNGAEYLCSKLPVRGPVDSWIGLNMFSNWDNVYGQNIGVGVHAKPPTGGDDPLPPRKILTQLLKFRAFAAMVPLCSQKVGTSGAGAAGGGEGVLSTGRRSWRQRDTDIEYSGNNL